MKKPHQCNRCLRGTMRAVRSKKKGEGKKRLQKCDNPKCGRTIEVADSDAESRTDAR